MFLPLLLIVASNIIGSSNQDAAYFDPKASNPTSIIHSEKTLIGDVTIFEDTLFGKSLSCNQNLQLTEKDAFMYHEMMAHVPLFATANPRFVLILGGVDGGILKEVLKHPTIDQVTLVIPDKTLLDIYEKHFASISEEAFKDLKTKVVIQDMLGFIKNTEQKFDVIICDPILNEQELTELYSKHFFSNCKKLLNPNAILVHKCPNSFLNKAHLKKIEKNRRSHFKNTQFYLTSLPSSKGGCITIGWASDIRPRLNLKTLKGRLNKFEKPLKYYNPDIHKASFALPEYMLE